MKPKWLYLVCSCRKLVRLYYVLHCLQYISWNYMCEHVARCGMWLTSFWFSSLRSLKSFSTQHGDPDTINQYQTTVSRSCGPFLLVLRTLEHCLVHWGSKVLLILLGGENLTFQKSAQGRALIEILKRYSIRVSNDK